LFWIYTAILSFNAVLFVVFPLWRSRSQGDQSEQLRRDANIALFQERNDELESELSAGNIDQDEFDKLLLELQRNLLSDVGSEEAGSAAAEVEQGETTKLSIVLPLVLVLLIPLLSYPLYRQWGFIDDVEVMDLFQATIDTGGDPEEARRLIVAIGEYAQDHPDMPWPFYFLAENFASLGMFEEAQISYQRAASLMEPNAEKALVLARVATAMYITSGLQFTPEILAVVEEARELNPNDMAILQLLAADAENNEDWEAAISYWRLLIQVSPNSDMAQQLRARIPVAQSMLNAEQGVGDGPVINVRLSLAEGLELDDNLRVFIAARNASQEGLPPLAAFDTQVGRLPTTIRLDNSAAVGPFNLSSADEVTITALVSYGGVASPNSGDYRVESEVLVLEADPLEIELTISDRLP